MSYHDHARYKVVSETQHLYEHSLDEFFYSHPALPGNSNVQDALDYIFNVLYPKVKPEVATPADLPTGVDTPNVGDLPPAIGDQRLVVDDGDGNYAMYIFAQWDGDPIGGAWHKIADYDFGENNLIQGLLDQTQYLYFRKYGATDYDPVTELALTGQDAGQHIYGGDLENQNLILHANNGDPVGRSGFIYLDDDTAPYIDLGIDLGTATRRFEFGYFGSLVVGTATMTITSDGVSGSITDSSGLISFDNENLITTGDIDGSIITASTNLVVDDTVDQLIIGTASITSSTGAISFGDENISTTGTLQSGVATIDTTLSLATGLITDTSGQISFGDENLITTGDIDAAIGTLERLLIDDLVLDGNAITISTLDTSLALAANGTGVIDLQSITNAIDTNITGTLTVTGQADIDQVTIDGTAISVVGDILTVPTLTPQAATTDLGEIGATFRELYISNSIHDGTNNILISDLMRLRFNPWRNIGMSSPAVAGDILVYDGTQWLASTPGGTNKYRATHTDVELGSPINVSPGIGDARNCIWQLYEVATGELLQIPLITTLTTVAIETNTIPIPAGNYQLIGIEVE